MSELKMKEFSAEPRGAAARFRRRQNDEDDDDVDVPHVSARRGKPSGQRNGNGTEKEALLEDKQVRRRRIIERVVFYACFYACLGAFFAIMMLIHQQTLDENKPKYQNLYGVIGGSPGLGFRPKPDVNESALIHVRQGIETNWRMWMNQLAGFVSEYEQLTQSSGGSVVQCTPDTRLEPGQVCPFDIRQLGTSYCTKENRFGYDRGNPCIILKLNKVYGWIPEPYNAQDQLPDDMPRYVKEEIRSRRRPPSVWMSCEGVSPADKEYIGVIEYFPYPGFPAYYFPYTKTPGYLSPIVAVHLKDPKAHVLIMIECRAWAKNIEYNRHDRMGSVRFELLRD